MKNTNQQNDSFYQMICSHMIGRGQNVHVTQSSCGLWTEVSCTPVCNLPQQGWKLHISATVRSAESVLRIVLPYLRNAACRFKVASSKKVLTLLETNIAQRSQVGKFITIYPRNEMHAVEMAKKLHEMTDGLHGPKIPSDRRLTPSSLVHYRYGSYVKQTMCDDLGQVLNVRQGEDGKCVVDARNPWFDLPNGMDDPFELAQLTQFDESEGPIGNKYIVEKALGQKSRGGVYLARRPDGSKCVLKEARAHTQVSEQFGDSVDRLKNEFSILSALWKVKSIPSVYEEFSQEGNYYIAMEYITGDSLRNAIAQRYMQGHFLNRPGFFGGSVS